MRRLLIFLACSFASQAAITNVQVSGVTSTQVIISACDQTGADITIEVAEAPYPDTGAVVYTPLIYDVDPAKFTNANSVQLRSGTVRRGNCYDIVVGKQGPVAQAYLALDGPMRTRADQQNQKHYFRLTEGASVVTGTFTTGALPLGIGYSEPIPGNASHPQYTGFPQIDWTNRNQVLIDPQTGVLHKRMTFPGMNGNSNAAQGGNQWPFSFGSGASWTNPASAILTSGAGATITASTDPLVLSFINTVNSQLFAISLNVFCAISGSPTGDDAKIQIRLSADGVNPYGLPHEITCPSTMPGSSTAVGDPIALNAAMGYFPTWLGVGNEPIIIPAAGAAPFAVNVSGSTVTLPNTLTWFDHFSTVGRLSFVNTGILGGGYKPVQIASQTNNYTVAASTTIPGSWSGNGTLVSASPIGPPGFPTPTFTTAAPHLLGTGDALLFSGVGGMGPPGTIWFAQVTGSATFTLKDVNGNNMDGSNIGSCCSGGSFVLQNTMVIPQMYFLVNKKTASANTLSFRANYSTLSDNPAQMNGGGGGVEACPPRGMPDGMVISNIDSTGHVTFFQTDEPHGFTIGSTVAMQIAGSVGSSSNVDGVYTANIVDNTHAQFNSWSAGAWSGHALIYQPGAPIGYYCSYINATGAAQLMNFFIPSTGEVRNLGYLVYPGESPFHVNFILNKNPVLFYTVHLLASGDTLIGGFYYRTRDIGQQSDSNIVSVDWTTIKTGVFAAIQAFEPLLDPAIFGPPQDGPSGAVMDQDHILLTTDYGQDSAGWTFVLDINGNVVASSSGFSYPPARFGLRHGTVGARSQTTVARALKGQYNDPRPAVPPPYSGPWVMTLQTNMVNPASSGPLFDPCPSSILVGGTFPATLGLGQCTTVQVSSTTPIAWALVAYPTPVGQNYGPLKVGDIVDLLGENGRVVALPDSTHVTFQRQYSPDHYQLRSCTGVGGGCNWVHNSGQLIYAQTGAIDYSFKPYAEALTPILWWDYINDPHGTNPLDPGGQDLSTATLYAEREFMDASHFDFKSNLMIDDSGGSLTGRGNAGTLPPGSGRAHGIRACTTSDQRNGCALVYTVNDNPSFSGLYGPCNGENCDTHPSIVEPDPNYAGPHPVTGLPTFPFSMDATNLAIADYPTRSSVLASGASQVWLMTLPEGADNKRLPLTVYTANYVLTDVSAPGKVLNDNDTDAYHVCVVAVADECWLGSTAGQRYANIPYTVASFGTYGNACTPSIGAAPMICAYLNPPHGGKAAIQRGMQKQDSTGELSRAISFGFAAPKYLGGNPNSRVTPDGNWAMLFTSPEGVGTMWLAKIGAYPPASSVNRLDFLPTPIQVPARAGATRAVVDYGYDETLHCMSRLDGCVANGNATTDTNPFYYATETYTGASCSSGCTINVNVHPGGRVLYYRRRWLNSSNVTVATESTVHVLAVP